MSQRNLKSPMWRFLCTSKFDLCMVAYPHKSHTWLLVPVCTFICPVSSKLRLNDLWHISHWKGRAVLWHTMCFDRRFNFKNAFPQYIHLNVLEDVWDLMWSISFTLFLCALPQVVHTNVSSSSCVPFPLLLAFTVVDVLLDIPTLWLADLEKKTYTCFGCC